MNFERLTRAAVNAALEQDRLARGLPSTTEDTEETARLLAEFAESDERDPDPRDVIFCHRAIAPQAGTVLGVRKAVGDAVAKLRGAGSHEERRELCLSVSRQSMAFERRASRRVCAF